VGGATKVYGAALYRLRREDFGVLAHYDGISPAWPIRYEDLEPYYTKAEQMYQVHGARGEDPTEPPSSAPYPHPAVSHEPRIQRLHDDLARAGYRPFHAPCGVTAAVAGGLIAFYQAGYGIAAFGVGPLQERAGLSLDAVFALAAIVALVATAVAFALTRPTTPSSLYREKENTA
jgi:choline dehydrogenase-like flavoprotein